MPGPVSGRGCPPGSWKDLVPDRAIHRSLRISWYLSIKPRFENRAYIHKPSGSESGSESGSMPAARFRYRLRPRSRCRMFSCVAVRRMRLPPAYSNASCGTISKGRLTRLRLTGLALLVFVLPGFHERLVTHDAVLSSQQGPEETLHPGDKTDPGRTAGHDPQIRPEDVFLTAVVSPGRDSGTQTAETPAGAGRRPETCITWPRRLRNRS